MQVGTEWQETVCKKCRCLDDYSVECTEKTCHDCPEVFVRTEIEMLVNLISYFA